MLKMQLPLKKAEEGEETAEDEKEQSGLFPELAFTAASGRLLQEPTEEPGAPFLTKESVYEWFGLHLSPAKRIEFMYGLLHMCQPLELRFLGSCLEDLARKDFHVLRDFEIRANSSSDLGLLTDVTDPVARSKLLVCLSLLGSDNRECAGILFRILSHVDPALLLVSSYPGSQAFDAFRSLSGDSDEDGTHNCGGFEPFVESRAGLLEQLAVLFTMASLHPAFLFHQRGKLRMQLEKLEQDLIQRQNRRQCVHHNTHAPPQGQPECHFTNSQVNANEKTQTHNLAPAHPSRRAEREGKAHAVHIEKIVLKGISRGKTEREYSFEVKWSDMSTSSITKTHLEMKNFLFQLPKEHSTDSFERSILQLLSQKNEGREVEQSLKEKFLSAPHAFRQTGKVCGFFHCGSLSSPSLSCSRRKPYKEDCSEASSQEEDMEPYVQEHRKKPGNKSPGLNMRSSEGKRTDHGSDNNNLTEWRKKSCTLKPICTQYTKPAGGEGENSSTKPKARSATSDCSEKRERGIGRVPFVSNGVMSLPSPRPHQPKGKDTAPCQNTYGETSSESYSSPSSPQHDGRESLESEDEKGKDTDSHSDDSRKSVADAVLVCPVTGGLDNALHSLVQIEHGGQEVQPEGTIQGYPQIHFTHHAPYKMPNGPEVLVSASCPKVPDNKVGTELMLPHPVVLPTQTVAIDDRETCSSETPSAVPSFNTSVLGLQPPGSPVLQPILHRFKTAGAQSGTECGVLVPPPHQTPLGAISVVQSGTTYPPALQVGYANPDQVLSSIIPAESHTKTPGLTLPSALPAAFNLPTATTGIPPMGTVGTASSSPVPAPVVPTHTPGPAPSPIPALTHSIAQSDGGYINSSASNNIPQLPQQQLPAARPVLGCNACGCRGSCGSTHVPDYYFHAQMAPRQVFNVPPIFQLTSLCSSNYLSQLNQTPQTNGATQVPFYPTAPSAFAGGTLLHHHSHTHSDHVLGSQAANFGLQQMTAFNRFYQPIYATTMVPGAGGGPGMTLGAVSGGINKKNGTISCYNCGGNGHYAQDCKQPLIDATQQGGFRLKYAPHSETLDNNPD
ncbi:zinc finger CCHC domain-containing protein 2 isoform X1 [Astyanax mexicanus]|uniref:zinc finger CCHC domain-containing protein 2 isoform X1 n=1 Tax=Astyanax mexicanus TaxID=7994 RepID=UPI0020CAB696|nr:zinc finger CCHC domain-containing protein 2 isoform X1 [Astyanax mexicanus]